MLLMDKVVIISGIGPGLGAKLALHAAREGARGVVIGGRTAGKLDPVEAAVRAEGTDVLRTILDIRNEADCERVARDTVARFGRIDALVNNAVFHGPMNDRAAAGDLGVWGEQYETNVIGTLRMSRAVLPQMEAQGGGAIVMINTMAAKLVSTEPEAGYAASKAALWAMTRTLATEVGPRQIRVNSFHPGWMWGEPVRGYVRSQPAEMGTEEQVYAAIAARFPLRRIATDDECARGALFLVSDYASAITGASLDANAGAFMP